MQQNVDSSSASSALKSASHEKKNVFDSQKVTGKTEAGYEGLNCTETIILLPDSPILFDEGGGGVLCQTTVDTTMG